MRAVNLANKQAMTGKFGSSKFQPVKETMICSPQKRKNNKKQKQVVSGAIFWGVYFRRHKHQSSRLEKDKT